MMPGLIFKTHEVYNFAQLPNPLEVGAQPLTEREQYDRHYHPHVGLLEYNNVTFPHIHIMDLRWTANNALKLINEIPTDAVSFVFQLSGINDVTYSRAGQHVRVGAAEHYMVYQPDGEFYNISQPNEEAHQLLVSVDKDFFAASVGCNSKWAEGIQNSILKKHAFLSSPKPVRSTPHMQHLVQGIIGDRSAEPMRNFRTQSRAMELIAAHIDQLISPAEQNNSISTVDVEKLNQLRAYLDQSFLEDHTLDQLSRKYLLNEFKLKRGFKLLFDVPVFAYIKNLRMNFATLLLKDGKSSVDEVAFLLGYEYPQHFSTAYKKHTGINPSHLRK
jgi:AraC-like DNA-binding protein